MVEDPELPFPESVAAAEIHKAGQGGAKAPSICSITWASARWLPGRRDQHFAPDRDFFFRVGQLGKSTLRLGPLGTKQVLGAGGVSTFAAPTVSPAYIGVGYIIGRNWLRSIFPAAWWRGVCSSRAHLLPGSATANLSAGRRNGRRLAGAWPTPSGVSSCGRLPWAA